MARPAPLLLASSDVIGFVLFGVFVLAFAVLSVVAVTWAMRRDRAGRAAWRERLAAEEQPSEPDEEQEPTSP